MFCLWTGISHQTRWCLSHLESSGVTPVENELAGLFLGACCLSCEGKQRTGRGDPPPGPGGPAVRRLDITGPQQENTLSLLPGGTTWQRTRRDGRGAAAFIKLPAETSSDSSRLSARPTGERPAQHTHTTTTLSSANGESLLKRLSSCCFLHY